MSNESDKSEYDKLGPESAPAGTFGTGLGGLLRGGVSNLCVTFYDDESCDGDQGSLAIP